MQKIHKRPSDVPPASRSKSAYIWRIGLIVLAVGFLAGCENKREQENQLLRNTVKQLTDTNTNLLQESAQLKSKVSINEALLKDAESRQQQDRNNYNSELAKLSEKHASELQTLNDKIRMLQSELATKDATLKIISEKADADARATARGQISDFETALVILAQMKQSAEDTLRDIAFDNLSLLTQSASEVNRKIMDIGDSWTKDFQSNKIKVWDYTKVTADGKDMQEISDSIRTFYTDIEIAFKEGYFHKPGKFGRV